VKELTGRNRNGAKDVRVLIRDLNPVLRGWGTYFRTGNAAACWRHVCMGMNRPVMAALNGDVDAPAVQGR
jgi:hypothetical protein